MTPLLGIRRKKRNISIKIEIEIDQEIKGKSMTHIFY